MYHELWRLWGIVESLAILTLEEEKTPDIEAEVKALRKEIKKHKPVLLEFERIMKEGKEELRHYR
jgi:hypothetical protein